MASVVLREPVERAVAEFDVPFLDAPRFAVPPTARDAIRPGGVDDFAVRFFGKDACRHVALQMHLRGKRRAEAAQRQADGAVLLRGGSSRLAQLFKLRRDEAEAVRPMGVFHLHHADIVRADERREPRERFAETIRIAQRALEKLELLRLGDAPARSAAARRRAAARVAGFRDACAGCETAPRRRRSAREW